VIDVLSLPEVVASAMQNPADSSGSRSKSIGLSGIVTLFACPATNVFPSMASMMQKTEIIDFQDT
jgi:hypothetical protein